MRYRIRTSGAFSVGALAGIGISGFEIQDLQSRMVQGYTFGGIGVGVSPTIVSGSIVSSWTEFEAACGLGDFGGNVLITNANLGVGGQSEMRWNSGPAMFTRVDTSGWELSMPGGSSLTGLLVKTGDAVKEMDTGREARWVSLAIWHPLYQRGQRYMHWQQWAAMWGRFDLNMWDLSGLTSATAQDSTWTWSWEPLMPQKHLPIELMVPKSGKWYINGGLACLRGSLDADLAGLEPAILSSSEKVEIRFNSQVSLLGGAPDSADSTGKINGGRQDYPVIWLVTGFKLTPR